MRSGAKTIFTLSTICVMFCSGCAERPLHIQAHWIEENESAPFSGVLLNEETYRAMREKIIECEVRE